MNAPMILLYVPVAAAYLLFSAFVALARHRGGVLGSCGCFGRPDTPATGAHLVLTAALAATAAAVALSPPATGWSGQARAPTALLLGFAGLLAALAYLVLAVLPTTTAAAVRGLPKG